MALLREIAAEAAAGQTAAVSGGETAAVLEQTAAAGEKTAAVAERAAAGTAAAVETAAEESFGSVIAADCQSLAVAAVVS